MAILSAEHSDQLFWLGRYSERVYTTIKGFAERFDSVMDIKTEEYVEYCKRQEIPNVYVSKEDFVCRYCFDEKDPNSIYSNLMRAFDNAVVLREEIGSETLAYIQLAVYAMNKAKASDAPLIHLQRVVDNIMAFWGMADDNIDRDSVRRILKLGKQVERVDLYARMKAEPGKLKKEVKRLSGQVLKTGMQYSIVKLAHLNYIIEVEPMDLDCIVEDVESIFDTGEEKMAAGF